MLGIITNFLLLSSFSGFACFYWFRGFSSALARCRVRFL